MGSDESKLSQPSKKCGKNYKICASAPCIPWRIIHRCSPEVWRRFHREYFNFPDRPMICSYQMPHECTPAFCLTRQSIINCRKSGSVFSLRKRKKCTKMAEHFEYNHIPARLSSIQNFHFKSVIASQCGLAVIHLTRNLVTQFAVLDLRLKKFLGSFGRQSMNFNPEFTIGKISPDGSWCLIKLPSVTSRRVCILKLYDLRSCALLNELLLLPTHVLPLPPTHSPIRPPLSVRQDENLESSLHPPGQFVSRLSLFDENPVDQPLDNAHLAVTSRSTEVLFAFDPRFMHARIAITNLDSADSNGDDSVTFETKPNISLVILPSWKCIARTFDFRYPSVANRYGTPTSGVTSSRISSGRRRTSDANHFAESTHSNGTGFTSPHVLSIFYSRDGHLLFVASTEHRLCRCSVIGNHASGTFFPFSSAVTPETRDDQLHIGRSVGSATVCEVSTAELAPDRRSHAVSFLIPTSGDVADTADCSRRLNDNSLLAAPTLPGCTTLWLTVFNSDNLSRLRTLRFDRPICPVHTCPTNYMPHMSRCGSRLALLTHQYAYLPPNHHIRSGLSLLRTPSCERLASASLRHSIPSINVDAYERAHNNYVRHVNLKDQLSDRIGTSSNPSRGLASSSPLLPPVNDIHLNRSSGSPDLFFSFSSPFPRMRFHDHGKTSGGRGSEHHSSGLSTVPTSSSLSVNSGSAMMRLVEVLVVYQLPPPPLLQALIRQKIRQIVQDDMLDRLDLPLRLISYLRFQPTFSCAGSCLSRSDSICAA